MSIAPAPYPITAPIIVTFGKSTELPGLPKDSFAKVTRSGSSCSLTAQTESTRSLGDFSSGEILHGDMLLLSPVERTLETNRLRVLKEDCENSNACNLERRCELSCLPVEPPLSMTATQIIESSECPNLLVVTKHRRRSCIKSYNAEEIPLHDKRGIWKQLAPPDLQVIRATKSSTTLLSVDSDCSARPTAVRFHVIQTREYRQTLGDNPSVSYGPPVCLDWTYDELPCIDLDEYEINRGTRRNMRQMMMNYYTRTNLLTYGCGCTEDEVKRASRDADRIKRSRSMTRTLLPAQLLEEAVQSVARKTKRWSKRGAVEATV
jgi:hypothetical protein